MNKKILQENLEELKADFEDLDSDEIIECKDIILKRITLCLDIVNEI
jgi:hypothetical protein